MTNSIKKWLYNFYLIYLYANKKVKVYHKGKEKSKTVIAVDLLKWMKREKSFNRNYFVFSLNLEENKEEDYIGRKEYYRHKNNVELFLKRKYEAESISYDVVTKDKYIANSLLEYYGIPSIKNIALIRNGRLLYRGGHEENLDALLNYGPVFVIKNILLEASEGFMHCSLLGGGEIKVNDTVMSVNELKDLLSDKICVLQSMETSIDEVKKVNSSALNTTRIVTILHNGVPEYLAGFQSFATGDAKTDSWDKGSVYVGMDPFNDRLKQYGYQHPSRKGNGLLEKHPDSGVVFKNYYIPGLNDAVKLCLNAHKYFYFNFLIGWDIALTPEGPKILEINEKPGMNAVQSVDGGLRKKIINYANEYLN